MLTIIHKHSIFAIFCILQLIKNLKHSHIGSRLNTTTRSKSNLSVLPQSHFRVNPLCILAKYVVDGRKDTFPLSSLSSKSMIVFVSSGSWRYIVSWKLLGTIGKMSVCGWGKKAYGWLPYYRFKCCALKYLSKYKTA